MQADARSWLWTVSSWIAPASGSGSFVHVGAVDGVQGDAADVARAISRRCVYALRVVSNVEVPEGTFAPMPCSVVNLGDPKTLDLAVSRLHALLAGRLLDLPIGRDLVEGLVMFDGASPSPHLALVLLMALGYAAPASATSTTAVPIEGGWVNGRSPEHVTLGGFAGVGGPHDVDFDRRLVRSLPSGTFR